MAKPSKNVVSVNFSNVGEGGSFRVPPGEYAVKVKVVKPGMSAAKKPKLTWELEGINGAIKGKKLYMDTSLQEQALFKLRNALLACKVNVPKSTMSIDLTKLKGLVMGVVIDDDEYKGKTKSAIIDTFPVTVKRDGKMVKEDTPDDDDFEDDDIDTLDEVEEEDEVEVEDEVDEEADYSSMDLEELKALCKERGIKVRKGVKKFTLIEALEAYDEDEEDDE